MTEKLLTDEEFGEITQTSRTLRWRWRSEEKLGYLNLSGRIRYTRQHLEDFIARCERPAKPKRSRGECD